MKAVEPLNMHGYNFPQRQQQVATVPCGPVAISWNAASKPQLHSYRAPRSNGPWATTASRPLAHQRRWLQFLPTNVFARQSYCFFFWLVCQPCACMHQIGVSPVDLHELPYTKPGDLRTRSPKPQHFHGPLFKSASDQDAAFSPWPVPNLPLL